MRLDLAWTFCGLAALAAACGARMTTMDEETLPSIETATFGLG
jgi:hypothetical protein